MVMFRRGIAACDECTKNCITTHHQEQRGPSSIVSRFFKIMHGKDYSEVLYLPPKFARDVRHLVGQKTQIEDSNGQKWTVQFSHVDGALAFQEGWRKFVEDHRLEHGEILVFNYIEHGLFVVQIYGLSACEIMDFNRGKNRPNKRSRSDKETVFQDEPHQITGIDSMDKPSSTPTIFSGPDFQNCQRHPIATNISISNNLRKKQFPLTSKSMEDPSCMLHRDSGQYQVEDRDFLFDLSNFEMEKNSSAAYKFETSLERSITAVETQHGEQIQVMEGDTPLKNQKNNLLSDILTDARQAKSSSNSDYNKDMPDAVSKFQAGETENNRLCGIFGDTLQAKPSGNSDNGGMQDDAPKFQAGGTNNHHSCGISSEALQAKPSGNLSRNMPDDVSEFQACETSVSPPCVSRDTKSPYVCRNRLSESDSASNSKRHDAPVTSSMLKDPFGKPAFTCKKEVVELREEVYGFPRASGEDEGISSTLGMKCSQISSSTVKTEPDMADDFVPAVATGPFSVEVKSLSFLELPSCMPSIQGRRERGRGKVVYLKDSTTRLWPVLYPGTSFVKAFTDGWKTFCKGNSIGAGHVCRFRVEKYTPCIFKVDVIHKDGQSSER